jgi:hypothetical protein
VYGGDVLALQLDVDYSDAGALPANSGLKFGDVRLCNLSTLADVDVSAANGITVRQLLADANTVLGGGTSILHVDPMDSLARSLNSAFDNGTPDSFAKPTSSTAHAPRSSRPTPSSRVPTGAPKRHGGPRTHLSESSSRC